jgi:3-oxoacyl-[acyl-carrier-protein] synthase II
MVRIVATAAGVVSPIGIGLAEFASALYGGKSGAAASARFPGLVTAEVNDFTPQTWLGNKGIRVLDRTARLLAVAAHLALTEGGLLEGGAEKGGDELGLVCGTMFGSIHSITSFDWSGITEGTNYVNPGEFPNTVINSAAGQAAIKHGLRGINSTISAGLASGLHAMQYGADCLRFGRARVVLAGGAEELCEESVLGFRKNGLVSCSGSARPFAQGRDGIVLGEGAALCVLETEESAIARGRTPWFEIRGFGCTQDAQSIRSFNMRGDGAAEAIWLALHDASIEPAQVNGVIASANGSRAGDGMEARALEKVFGARAGGLAICAPKGALGEWMGATGAASTITAGLAMRAHKMPPTAGFEAGGHGLHMSSNATPISGEYALINAFGCDGNNASMVIRQWNN